jgi:hypothetical protein
VISIAWDNGLSNNPDGDNRYTTAPRFVTNGVQ